MHRAARWGDGWLPVFAAPNLAKINQETFIHSHEELRDKIVMLKDLRAAAGKTGKFEIGMAPRQQPQVGTREGADRYLQSLATLREAGVTWGIVDLPHKNLQSFLENVHWFGEEVVARMDASLERND